MVTDKAEQKYKPSAAAVAYLADRVVLFDGQGFDIDGDDFSLVDGRWMVRIPATAIILAGGRSRRTGRDKSMLPIEGKPIIKHIVERLGPWFSQVIVSSNEVEKYGFLGVEVVPDKIPGRGPLMGIASALAASANELNFVVACDIPEIDMAFVRMMISQARRFDAVVPVTGPTHYEPVFAVYKKKVVEVMEQTLASGNNKIIEALGRCNVKYVDAGAAARFGNLNTMEDYREFVRRHSDPAG
jgi:molybdopterin-guanine dinucleotide biosynthesis protein A